MVLTGVIAAPSAIVAAIQSTGRDAILRGSGGTEGMLAVLLTLLGIIADHLFG